MAFVIQKIPETEKPKLLFPIRAQDNKSSSFSGKSVLT
jgi:hypothetical protein